MHSHIWLTTYVQCHMHACGHLHVDFIHGCMVISIDACMNTCTAAWCNGQFDKSAMINALDAGCQLAIECTCFRTFCSCSRVLGTGLLWYSVNSFPWKLNTVFCCNCPNSSGNMPLSTTGMVSDVTTCKKTTYAWCDCLQLPNTIWRRKSTFFCLNKYHTARLKACDNNVAHQYISMTAHT